MSPVRNTYSLSEISEAIPQLLEHFEHEPEPEVVTVTDHGQPVMAIVPWKLYELITQAVKCKRLAHENNGKPG